MRVVHTKHFNHCERFGDGSCFFFTCFYSRIKRVSTPSFQSGNSISMYPLATGLIKCVRLLIFSFEMEFFVFGGKAQACKQMLLIRGGAWYLFEYRGF